MAEEKDYLELEEEGGTIHISFAALGEIASQAALAVPGVSALAAVPQATVRGVQVQFSEIGICTIDLHLLLTMEQSFSQVAKQVQTAVKTAVDAAVGIEVAAVNIFVAGVTLK
ncbi:MAG: Asp23/Gls24 family envelope stress response protein [Clostridia bacterium]|nr:Asp23/Gls24 family envelope stress response protein [Clostridia bacterium]